MKNRIIKSNFLVILFIFSTLLLLSIRCKTELEPQSIPDSSSTCGTDNTTFSGLVLEESLNGSAGNPVPMVSIQTSPTITNVTLTDATGSFSATVACDAKEYTFTATKYGYETKTFSAIANKDNVTVQFTLKKDDTKYQFITISIVCF